MNKKEFKEFVNQLQVVIESMSRTQSERINCKTTPTDFEKLVVEASKILLKEKGYQCKINYTEGGHSFPDIVYNFCGNGIYGIEVKSSINLNSSDNSWIILGNSILGTTRIDVDDLYILFIKVNKNGCFIKHARYEDSISDVVVTHSPRYKINLVQEPKASFFAKSGISYGEMNSSEDPIGLVTEYFRKQGQTAWWIAESTPAIIKTWEEVIEEERKTIFAKAFVLFPELISSKGAKKYKRLSKWLAANYSIVDSSLRDRFTAGGRVDLTVGGKSFKNMPRIYESFQLHIDQFYSSIKETSLEELRLYWETYIPQSDNTIERLDFWFHSIRKHLEEKETANQQIEFLECYSLK